MKKLIMICALSCMLLANVASAALIVDTGEPPGALVLGGVLSTSQRLSGEFTLDQAYTVTDVVGWMNERRAGDITVAIYGDGGNVPDAGLELYSHTFYADIPDGTLNVWLGAEGVSWDLGPGTYWAAFEVRAGDADFIMPAHAPFPLDNYAHGPAGVWYSNSADHRGLRVYGDEAAAVIPAPGAILLGSIGVGVVSWLRRRRTL